MAGCSPRRTMLTTYGVYNPVDGVGTPFFAGYYGPAGDSDEDDNDSGFPFGHPYPPR